MNCPICSKNLVDFESHDECFDIWKISFEHVIAVRISVYLWKVYRKHSIELINRIANLIYWR